MVQPWADKNWARSASRVEVAITFLEGDVNRPVAVGSLYNNNTPTFAVADKNKSAWHTHSTKNGGSSSFNELSFNDTMGNEIFYLYADKDYTLEVENNQPLTSQKDRSVTITNDEPVKINGKKTDTVKGDHALTVSESNQPITVSIGNQSLNVSSGSISHTTEQSITL
ncbi:MAG: hypothetical protein B7Z81_09070 [Acidocella sp. 20-61-6]|nr:MAG: hypothetical protein B7Z81_09070 [Acidocella sp. 20-61-6]